MSSATVTRLREGGSRAVRSQQEFAAHVRGALNNGLRPEQVLELVRHCAAYCGAPVALSAMRTVAGALEAHAPGSEASD